MKRNINSQDVFISHNKNGKPYLKNNSALFFNISHSAELSMCVVSENEVGCDIQKIKSVNLDLSKRFFTENERDYIFSDSEYNYQLDRFLRLWTLKESVLKAVGLGLALDMRNIDFSLHETVSDDKASKINGEQGTVDRRYYTNVNGEEFIGYVLNAPEGYSASYVEKIIK